MSMVRVWNDNVIDHKEMFKGTMLNIPSKGSIEMDSEEAVLFRGQFYPPKFNKGGVQTIESMKCIRVEEIKSGASKEPAKEEHKCMKCGEVAASAAGLKSHIRHKHIDSLVDDDAKKELLELEG
jgi:hypothetical protein